MKLKEEILELLDVYYPEGEDIKIIKRDLMRRGKIDNRKIIEIIFKIVDRVYQLEMTKDKK